MIGYDIIPNRILSSNGGIICMRSTTKLLVVYVMIIVDSGKEREVINKIKKFPGVTEVKSVYGEYDIIARIELSDPSVLEHTVTQIRRIPGIAKTSTLISMN